MPPTLIRWGADYPVTGESGPPVGFPVGTGSPYPQTVGGVTLGWNDGLGALSPNVAAGWVSGDDPLGRGRWRVSNGGTARSARIDLAPLGGPGLYRIRMSAVAHGYQECRWRVRDGVGGLAVIDVSWTGASATAWGSIAPGDLDQFVVLNAAGTGVVHAGPIDANMLSPDLPFALVTFSSSSIEIVNGGHASTSFSSDLSFITLEKVAVPIADGLRLVPGSLPDPIVAGTAYTVQVEAWDSTLSLRDTTYDDPEIALTSEAVAGLPSGYIITAGDPTQPMVDGLAEFPGITWGLAPLDAPVLTAGTPVDAPTTRTVTITNPTDPDWPAGVAVQLQTRRGAAAFANSGTATATSRALVLAREVAEYTIDVRGIAKASGGAPPDSAASAVLTITVPALASTVPLDAPVLTAGTPVDAPTTRTVTITNPTDPDWPAGVAVQLQTRRGAAAFANSGTATATSRALVLAREVAEYTIDVRGIAKASGGAPPDSAASAVLTITVPALASIPALSAATPLRCLVTMYPSTSAPIVATAGGGTQSLTVRAQTDHVLRLQQIVAEITGTPHAPKTVRYTIEAETGVISTGSVASPTAPDDWQLPLSRGLFSVDRAALVLVLTLVAQDDSETTMWFTLARGLRQ